MEAQLDCEFDQILTQIMSGTYTSVAMNSPLDDDTYRQK